ncbi:MAG TPA: ABC-F family ATP-binding cassette domain-containing protein [Gemmatimonadaceae bacterium]|nr:ABC-F family ATP-binding cassette domain-containing protein [Gemmatimonadaceae bacterium]
MTQLQISNVAVEFGATRLFQDVTFTVASGERWGIVGRNGTGKTTLFRLLTGEMQPTRGTVVRQSGLRVSLLEQHRDFGSAETVWQAAAGGLRELLTLEQSLLEQAHALGSDASEEALSRYGHDLERFEREGGYEATARIDSVLSGLGFEPQQARTTPVAQLSGGERGRLGLARELVRGGDVLLLDEPTNHLDLETTRWLEQYLRDSTMTVLLISHDRAFLQAVADHILHFEGDSATPYVGGYSNFVVQREERRLSQQRAFDKQQRTIAHEQDYIARNIAGQNSRQAKGRRTRLTRLPRLSAPITDDDAMSIRFDVAQRGGDRVAIADRATVSVTDAGSGAVRILVESFTGSVRRGDVLGLVGPNGAGKSTLLKALVGQHATAAGELRLGSGIDVGYYRQDLSQVPLEKTLYEIIADLRPAWERRLVQGHLGRFGFSGDEVQRRPETLSGGERARVALAMLMLSRSNLLILDEPTNHLDVESIEALEDALEQYEGTVILVSHDRELLRGLTGKLWLLHERHITEFDGGFAEWEAVSAERARAAAVRASEEAALRRVHERQRLERTRREEAAKGGRTSRDLTRDLRRAQRAVEEAEQQIETLETKIATISAALEDPQLYTRPTGPTEAKTLGGQLESLKRELDAVLERWTAATEEAEALNRELAAIGN